MNNSDSKNPTNGPQGHESLDDDELPGFTSTPVPISNKRPGSFTSRLNRDTNNDRSNSIHGSNVATPVFRSTVSSNSRLKSVSEYAVNVKESLPKDEWEIHADDENLDFFQKGRELQSRKEKHRFTQGEKKILASYQSTALKPSHTSIYRIWLAHSRPISDTESWIIIIIIAVIIGCLTFVMKAGCEKLQIFGNPFIMEFVERGKTSRLWLYLTGMSTVFGALSAITVVYICPAAGGSGVPEIIGILNGCVIPNCLGLKTLICKIISVMFTVISGLPVGFEGPMIHIGAMVAAATARPCDCCNCQDSTYIEQPEEPGPNRKSRLKKIQHCFGKLCRYRDCAERHNLMCMGTAAGVASAFSSPITGLTFAMEEMSTHWNSSLTWQTFVCCILSRSTTELLHSVTSALESKFVHNQTLDMKIFELSESALFDMKVTLEFSLAVFLPTVIIGVSGGFLGSLYVFLHLKMAKVRRRFYSNLTKDEITKVIKVFEVVVLCFVCSTLTMISMPLFECNRVNHSEKFVTEIEGRHLVLRNFNCHSSLKEEINEHDNVLIHEGQFHEGASLLFGSWEQMVRNLLSRKTPDFFGLNCLFLVFLFFFVFSAWTALTSIASGLLIPQLAIGALYGRLIGKLIFDLFRLKIDLNDDPAIWDFTDPGAMALLGAAAFFAGTSRQPITSVVMIAEMTNDINMSLLVMVVVMLSKFIGDMFTHSLFHSLIEFKCFPILEPELKVYRHGKKVQLELYTVGQIMATPVVVLNLKSSVYDMANILLNTDHGGFPVVKPRPDRPGSYVFLGLITRLELTILLTKTQSFNMRELTKKDYEKIRISYPEYSSTKLRDCKETNHILHKYSTEKEFSYALVDLEPFINLSVHTISIKFSVPRAYTMFRDLGLRHLVVVDEWNSVRGMITRKDLMGFNVEDMVKEQRRKMKTRLRRDERRDLINGNYYVTNTADNEENRGRNTQKVYSTPRTKMQAQSEFGFSMKK